MADRLRGAKQKKKKKAFIPPTGDVLFILFLVSLKMRAQYGFGLVLLLAIMGWGVGVGVGRP